MRTPSISRRPARRNSRIRRSTVALRRISRIRHVGQQSYDLTDLTLFYFRIDFTFALLKKSANIGRLGVEGFADIQPRPSLSCTPHARRLTVRPKQRCAHGTRYLTPALTLLLRILRGALRIGMFGLKNASFGTQTECYKALTPFPKPRPGKR
jgi:hypothetical protein